MVRWITSQINFCFTSKTQGREPQDPGLFPVLCPTRVGTLSRAFNPQSGTETPHQPSRFVRGWPPRAWGRLAEDARSCPPFVFIGSLRDGGVVSSTGKGRSFRNTRYRKSETTKTPTAANRIYQYSIRTNKQRTPKAKSSRGILYTPRNVS